MGAQIEEYKQNAPRVRWFPWGHVRLRRAKRKSETIRWRDRLAAPAQCEALVKEKHGCAQLGLTAIDRALVAANHISALLLAIEQVVLGAEENKDPSALPALADLYEKLRNEIDRHAMAAKIGSINLIDGMQGGLSFHRDLEHHADLTLTQTDLTAGRAGLKLPALRLGLTCPSEVCTLHARIDNALAYVKWAEGVLMSESILVHHRFATVLTEQEF